MKSGIDVDPMFMRLPNRPPAGAEPKDGTAPAWRREMERAQMEAWLGHSMVGFASPAAAGKKMEALRPPDASSSFDAVVLPTNKTGNTAEQRMQERTHRMAVDRPPLNRAHQVQGSHIESSSQVQVSATSGNRRGGEQASMAARDHTRALRESRDLPPTIDAHARTEQLISLFQSLDAMAATNAEEQHGGIDAASQLLVPATADAPSTSVGSVPAMLAAGNLSTLAFVSQDGFLPAALTGVGFDALGTLILTYANGQTVKGSKLSLGRFDSLDAVESVGSNQFDATNSLAWHTGLAGDGGFGSVRSGMVELSNVDLSQEFSDLVIMQRGYQASSQVISTANDMLQELFQMKSK